MELGICLGWKGQCICCVTRGREGGREGRREGGKEGAEGGRGGREGGMTVIHIIIGMFNSNPMTPQYLNTNLT